MMTRVLAFYGLDAATLNNAEPAQKTSVWITLAAIFIAAAFSMCPLLHAKFGIMIYPPAVVIMAIVLLTIYAGSIRWDYKMFGDQTGYIGPSSVGPVYLMAFIYIVFAMVITLLLTARAVGII